MTLEKRDLQHIWHPCSQMKDYQSFPPLEVVGAQGCYLHLANGQKIIDAISSWWCKSLGHGHPRLRHALQQQSEQFEHVILANTTNNVIVQLAEKLASLTPSLNKVSFASDGSCAIEMALKMSVHAQQLLGHSQRTQFMALENAYHGETCLALSVSDLGLYKSAYQPLLHDISFIKNIPYVTGKHDPLWHDCSAIWPRIEAQLNQQMDTLSAIIIEPVLQGAGGMKIYSADFLKRLRRWTQQQGIHLIADEIMTGLGRTGLPLACEHAGIEADFLCMAKGLTSGWLPMSVMLTSTAMYNLFYDDYETGKAFMHSHTHTGNALAAAVALETLNILDDENIYQLVQQQEACFYEQMQIVAEATGKLTNLRHIGGMVAADLVTEQPRLGYQIYQQAIQKGALLRPLGNTIYWLPPLNIEQDTLVKLRDITIQAIKSCY
ncbi:MAG: adenosylmethionine--8-amino-7-oxononanoate transaminase [Gammaproteobacteria bacterium]|nr:adenosylmethionine--8-amino-7-oxononanoate transaminase [Gammaproteobacteria bacterium]